MTRVAHLADGFDGSPFGAASVLSALGGSVQVPQQGKTVLRLEVGLRSIIWILATLVGAWLFFQLRAVALLLLVSLVFVGTFNPLVEWMERRGLKRVHALALLFVALLLATSVLTFLTVPPLLEQLAQIVRDAPGHREHLIGLLQQRDVTQPLARAVQNAGLEELFARIERALMGYWPRAVAGLGWGVTTLFLSFYLLADGKRTQGVLYAIVPRAYHMRLARILHNLEAIVGGYMRGQLVTSAAIGVFTFLLLLICKVPHALALALFAALADVIPFIGGLLAATPAVFAALPRGWPVTVAVGVSLFVYQEIENRILIPRVYGHALRLSPTTVILALLSGGILLGPLGALLALPVTAGLQMIVAELRLELPGDDSEDPSGLAQDATTDATYERMSTGSTAPEAGQIARQLESDVREAEDDAERAESEADDRDADAEVSEGEAAVLRLEGEAALAHERR